MTNQLTSFINTNKYDEAHAVLYTDYSITECLANTEE